MNEALSQPREVLLEHLGYISKTIDRALSMNDDVQPDSGGLDIRLDISTAISVLEGMDVEAHAEKEVPTKRKVTLKLTAPVKKGPLEGSTTPRAGPVIKNLDTIPFNSLKPRA